MKPFAIAASILAGAAAFPAAAKAANLLLIDSTGRAVAVLVPVAPARVTALPADLFAEQDAIMERMMRRMEAAFAAPLSLDLAPPAAMPNSTIVTTSFSDGRTSCSRTVTYEQRGSGAPVMQVRQSGAGCDALPSLGRTQPVPAATPEPAPETPAQPAGAKLIRVEYRHPALKPATHKG